MMVRPQLQCLISAARQVQPFNCDGCLRSYLDEDGQELTLLALFDGRQVHHLQSRWDTNRLVQQLSRHAEAIAVFGICPAGQVPVNLPAGKYAGALLIRPAKESERDDPYALTGAITTVATLKPVTLIGFGQVFTELPNPHSYPEIF